MKLRISAMLGVAVSISAAAAHATVSCDEKYHFVGFDADYEAAIVRLVKGGDCAAWSGYLRYDFNANRLVPVKGVRELYGKGMHSPEPFILPDGSEASLSISGRKGKRPDGFADYREVWLKGIRACKFKRASFEARASDQFRAKEIAMSYYNPKFDKFFVIQNNCSSAAMAGYSGYDCYTTQSIAVYDMKDCE